MVVSQQRPPSAQIVVTPLVYRVLLALLATMVVIQTAKFSGLVQVDEAKTLVDFDAFHIAGQMVWRGEIDRAYHFLTMLEAQRLLGGGEGFLPWAYPPQFNLLVAPLALLPLGLAYFVFTAATLAAYLLVLHRIAAENVGAVLLATFPALIVTIACGQNGFLSGTLIGLACLAFLQRGSGAGLPLGLMVIKPHLTAGFVLFAFAARRWGVIAIAAGVVGFSAALATLAFGPRIWVAFLQGGSEARVFLEAGLYPLFRMVSIYAVVRSIGFSAPVAMAAQAVVALLALAMVWTAIRRMSPPQALGLAAIASLLVSPYAYDYDLPIYGIALAWLMPDLLRLTTRREQVALLGLSWLVCIWGLAQTGILRIRFGENGLPEDLIPLSLAGAALLALVGMVWRVLRRDDLSDRTGAASFPPASLAARA